MEWNNSEFGEVGNQLVLPLFKGVRKAPNNSLSGLNRTQRTLVREAIASDDFEGKKGQRMAVWSPGCRVLLVGMGEKGRGTPAPGRWSPCPRRGAFASR